MRSQTPTTQARLDGIEQVLCKCGCGHYFMAAKTPRMREYLNDTHKKRAARARAKARTTDDTVRLTGKGWLYMNTGAQDDLDLLWENFEPNEQAIIMFICNTGIQPEQIAGLLVNLFGVY